MKNINYIPKTKIARASKLVETGLKVGGNYIKYYGNQLSGDSQAKEKLDADNAEDIYDGLKTMKGSALKVAQMLSMEKNIMPKAYVEQFSLAQFSVPPLSPPLVRQSFKRYYGKYPEQLFDRFEKSSRFAASIGQVHQAEKDGKKLAVKIQYPGVADSIGSDLALVKPFALKLFNIRGKDSDRYFQEVEQKLLEETDYKRELNQSLEIKEACKNIKGLKFPEYYPELSTDRILVMDWISGNHLSEQMNLNQEQRNKLGQTLWDFYMYQIHVLRKVHADPHPGNFLIDKNKDLVALDFGCMKEIPEEFYVPYFDLVDPKAIADDQIFDSKLKELEILRPDDSQAEIALFTDLFREMLSLFTQPFQHEEFDFSNDDFFEKIASLGKKYAANSQLKEVNGNRGSKHFIYINRTFFGLYNLMHDIGAQNVKINTFKLN
ncbi:AarF/ABC1/UbiB kinase family protein [Flavobacteriaceae bacterium]|nr:AarF/ABC1/UbiB kinase family protein [Flavobacteriaceae bacterium]